MNNRINWKLLPLILMCLWGAYMFSPLWHYHHKPKIARALHLELSHEVWNYCGTFPMDCPPGITDRELATRR